MPPPKPTAPPGYRVTRYAVPTRRNCDAWMPPAYHGDAITWDRRPEGSAEWLDNGKRWLLRKVAP